MTLSQSFLSLQPETEAAWQARLAAGGCFVVAEASLNDAVPWLAERWGGSLEQTRLYWGDAGRVHASVSPYCIPVHAANWPQVREHLVTQPGWGVGIQLDWFMQAYSPLDQLLELVKHLRQWSLVATQEGGSAILRISDWAVLTPLLAASSVPEATALCGPIATFCDIAPDGSGQSLTLTERTAHNLPDTLPRTLSDVQWQALLAPALRQTLDVYMAHLRAHHARWQASKDDDLLAFTRQQTEQARIQGFNNDRDIVRYLALATELTPAFIQQPWAQDILAQPEYIGEQNRMDRLYQAAIAQLDDA
ncbi:DUF4123 domain-containing protein [Dickeya undicola]|uniref:DUF4123 domain-containing protein n=1 Tax=Dickeya undicola TaxID=1577887 RepID=A0ABX9WQV9_9GAMM|nr:DUF4123 domain-containing protein [Dickeya undicola]RNM21689.1 DUF4123 domain-containing protein [Dickeya undicola]